MPKGSWLNYQIILECQLSEDRQKELVEMADKCKGGAFCPYFHCYLRYERNENPREKNRREKRHEKLCPEEISLKCGASCSNFYKKYIKEEKK